MNARATSEDDLPGCRTVTVGDFSHDRGAVEVADRRPRQERQTLAGLTDTERAIAELVAQGLTNRQIAERVFVSRHTVDFHLRSIYRKVDVTSRIDLTRQIVSQAAAR